MSGGWSVRCELCAYHRSDVVKLPNEFVNVSWIFLLDYSSELFQGNCGIGPLSSAVCRPDRVGVLQPPEEGHRSVTSHENTAEDLVYSEVTIKKTTEPGKDFIERQRGVVVGCPLQLQQQHNSS
ncbi:hypothetical protein chiPu_0020781 [Chiloscyllium punctatum]|uniref:Uncharacterized protein n=1 Tax=Chiloscyllium punctatum TaxID=137246 RepID=A0A401RJP6_CHIPU|nr:hypothetical protein [Chiloscyllium punctatum]